MPPPFSQTPSSLDSFLTNLIFSVKLEMIPMRALCVQSLQSCSTLCSSMDHSPLGSSVHGVLQAKNTGMGCHALLRGIFPTQGSNPYLFKFPALGGRFFTTNATCKTLKMSYLSVTRIILVLKEIKLLLQLQRL